jgi:hypothetical protein
MRENRIGDSGKRRRTLSSSLTPLRLSMVMDWILAS